MWCCVFQCVVLTLLRIITPSSQDQAVCDPAVHLELDTQQHSSTSQKTLALCSVEDDETTAVLPTLSTVLICSMSFCSCWYGKGRIWTYRTRMGTRHCTKHCDITRCHSYDNCRMCRMLARSVTVAFISSTENDSALQQCITELTCSFVLHWLTLLVAQNV